MTDTPPTNPGPLSLNSFVISPTLADTERRIKTALRKYTARYSDPEIEIVSAQPNHYPYDRYFHISLVRRDGLLAYAIVRVVDVMRATDDELDALMQTAFADPGPSGMTGVF